MSVYYIGSYDIHDPAAFAAYPPGVLALLPRYEGRVPVEMFGRTPFPPIGELPYLLTLGPRGFFWFQLTEAEEQ